MDRPTAKCSRLGADRERECARGLRRERSGERTQGIKAVVDTNGEEGNQDDVRRTAVVELKGKG